MGTRCPSGVSDIVRASTCKVCYLALLGNNFILKEDSHAGDVSLLLFAS